MRKNFYILVLTYIFIILFTSISFAYSTKIEVKVIVSPMQEVNINEAVGVRFNYPWDGMESGQALIFENVGNVKIKSNVAWLLNINSLETYRDLDVYIRPVNDRKAVWQRIDDSSGFVSGRSGSNDLSWDIKIEYSRINYDLNNRSLKREDIYTDKRNVNMIFTLTTQ